VHRGSDARLPAESGVIRSRLGDALTNSVDVLALVRGRIGGVAIFFDCPLKEGFHQMRTGEVLLPRRKLLGGGLMGLLAVASGCGDDTERAAPLPVQPDVPKRPPPEVVPAAEKYKDRKGGRRVSPAGQPKTGP
jgi:hypothetical protein